MSYTNNFVDSQEPKARQNHAEICEAREMALCVEFKCEKKGSDFCKNNGQDVEKL
jgi:hypothetical protein